MLSKIKLILQRIKSIFDVPMPPYSYNFLINLKEKEYPKYLKKVYKASTGRDLNLKNPKTFSEKIQWLKLYDNLPIKTTLTDKVLVRDWVEEKIGSEYLKPIISINDSYDEINFSEFPESFIIKTNHGCKWHYKIKNKNKFLESEALQKIIRNQLTDWLSLRFYPFAGFELQYKNIIPKLISEPLLLENPNDKADEIEIYCFNGVPKIYQRIKYSEPREVSIYDENFNNIDLKFINDYIIEDKPADECLKQAVELSKKLCEDFKLVRVDWLVYNGKIYFNEMTFTPFSGFYIFEDESWDLKLGNMLDLKK